MAGVGENLEDIARSIKGASKNVAPYTPHAQLTAEIALLSERIDKHRKLHDAQLLELLREECQLNTYLMRLESSNPGVYWHRGEPREALLEKVSDLKRERRRMIRDHDGELGSMQEHLCKLLMQHAGLGGAGR